MDPGLAEAYVTEKRTGAHRAVQMYAALSIVQNKPVKLEFFFYTNLMGKALKLAMALKQKNYTLEPVRKSMSGNGLWLTTGLTHYLCLDPVPICDWAEMMCKTGLEFDCSFDGWGIYIES